MVRSAAKTPDAYLDELPHDRREVISAMRKLIRKNLPKGYDETVNWGMLCYEIPLSRYPDTYNEQPLAYVALAAQKNNYALYLMRQPSNAVLMDRLAAAYEAAGRKFDMGKSWLRFKALDELRLDISGDIVSAI